MLFRSVFKDRKFVTAQEGEDVGADLFERGLCLPSDIKMTKDAQDIVIAMIKSCFGVES